ncbi:hypothetical protein VPH35_021289 [Triticum aestivum]|uniref:Uncharacterized protein n=1 Tax=Triticum urartu TaxID=4572 RepID=A0A8R7TII0_TRIUA
MQGRERGEEREVRQRTGEGDRPASACAPPGARTLAERQNEGEREKEGEEGEIERKEEREVRRLTGERVIGRRRRGRAQPGRDLEVGGCSIHSWIGSCDEAGARARCTGWSRRR